MLFLQSFKLLLNVPDLPSPRLVVNELLTPFLLVFDVRLVIFIRVTFDLRQVLAIDLPLAPFQLEHVLLHDLFLLQAHPLILDQLLRLLSQSFYFYLKRLQFLKISNSLTFFEL